MTLPPINDDLSSNNASEWDSSVVEMLAMRKPPLTSLPLLYQEIVELAGGPVLLLCSGLGLRAIQFARAGYPVTCIDLSPAMIEYTNQQLAQEDPAVRRLVELRCEDVREPAGYEQFGLIILEEWDFAQMLTQEDQLACLAVMRDALVPDGLAVIDVFSPYYKMTRDHVLTGEPMVFDFKSPDTGLLNRRTSRSEFDHLTQIETMHVLFEVYKGDCLTVAKECTWKLRHTTLQEFELLLKIAGLRTVLRCPDFAFDRPLSQQPEFDHATDDFAFILQKT